MVSFLVVFYFPHSKYKVSFFTDSGTIDFAGGDCTLHLLIEGAHLVHLTLEMDGNGAYHSLHGNSAKNPHKPSSPGLILHLVAHQFWQIRMRLQAFGQIVQGADAHQGHFARVTSDTIQAEKILKEPK